MLAAHLRRRRQRADLFLAFVVTSAGWLVAGIGLALAAGLSPGRRTALTAAAVVALAGWLLEALAGHALKVVPLIAWPALPIRRQPACRRAAGWAAPACTSTASPP